MYALNAKNTLQSVIAECFYDKRLFIERINEIWATNLRALRSNRHKAI